MRIAEPLFPNDDGSADPLLLAALAGGDRYEIVAALGKARVFVALLAHPESGVKIEQESEMSLAWLVDGSVKALPIFSSISAITAWNALARPLGVEAQRAAVVALDDGAIAVLDPASLATHEVGASALRSLALGYEYLPLSIDQDVARAIAEALTLSLGPGHGIQFSVVGDFPSDLVITLLDPSPLPSQAKLTTFATHLAEDARIRLRLEAGLEIKIARR